jgi:hypothetical protein
MRIEMIDFERTWVQPCQVCGGTGNVPSGACGKCEGRGRLLITVTAHFVPAPREGEEVPVPQRSAAVVLDEADFFLSEVKAELSRARAKFPGRRIMMLALAEEFGELAKALLDDSPASIRREAVQTAVMAARVAIDGDESVDVWRSKKGLGPVGIGVPDTSSEARAEMWNDILRRGKEVPDD